MPTTTQRNDSLVLTLNGTSVACQVVDLSFKRPGYAPGATTEVACGPDAKVVEPGTPQDGSLTGNVFTDTAVDGLWWLLDDAFETDADIDYVLTFFPELGPEQGVTFTGVARNNTSGLDFSKPGLNKHPLDLRIITAVKSRPVA